MMGEKKKKKVGWIESFLKSDKTNRSSAAHVLSSFVMVE